MDSVNCTIRIIQCLIFKDTNLSGSYPNNNVPFKDDQFSQVRSWMFYFFSVNLCESNFWKM